LAAAELGADIYTFRRAERLVAQTIGKSERGLERRWQIAKWNGTAASSR
jgi:hypothetical protein